MDNRNLETVHLDPESMEEDVIGSNPVLTLITTEDGIPTSTEVTVLTTTLGDIPLMTTLGAFSEVPLVPTTTSGSTFPTFVTSHPGGVRTIYANSLSSHPHGSQQVGQVLVGEDGRITLVDSDGIQRTLVLHAADASAFANVQVHQAGPSSLHHHHEVMPRIVSLQQVVPSTQTLEIVSTSSHAPSTTPILIEQTLEEQHQQVLEDMEVVPTQIIEDEEETQTATSMLVSAVVDDIISRSQQQAAAAAALAQQSQEDKKFQIPSQSTIESLKDKPKQVQDLSSETVDEIIASVAAVAVASPAVPNVVKATPADTKLNSEPPSSEEVVPSTAAFEILPDNTEEEEVGPPVPDEFVCLVCYQAYPNPQRRKDEKQSSDEIIEIDTNVSKIDEEKKLTNSRTLANFFELSRVSMSILVRRSYKDYEVPICQTCDDSLSQADKIIRELKALEKELYIARQNIKDEIIKSFILFKNSDNKELIESRNKTAGLREMLEIVDRIREDIANDGRPPKMPSLTSRNSKRGRRPKSGEKPEIIVAEAIQSTKGINELSPVDHKDADTTNTDLLATDATKEPCTSSADPVISETEQSKPKPLDTENEEEKATKPAIRTSFGRIVKRPAYMMMNELTADELSELGESSDDNYEEIEVKPDLPAELISTDIDNIGQEQMLLLKEEDIDEEDPAWYPGNEMIISDKIGLPVSSSGESELPSDYDSEADGHLTKVKVKKVRKPKRDLKEKRTGVKKLKQKYTKRKAKKNQNRSLENVNYEVKVIQLDGTELMSINATGADENIGLEPEITQKVMDSQAVIMVKNQLFGKRVQCNYCSKTFTDPGRRDIHVMKKHEGETKPFACEVCHKRFGRQDHLRNHMKRHTRSSNDIKPLRINKAAVPEKTQTCHYCDQRFRNKSELAVHIRLHTGERPYKCDHCMEAFVSALKREFHIEQMHPEVPPIRCEFCPRGFYRQHRLRIHAISHTREKTNICEICGRSFSQAAMLRYHQTTHEELNLKQFKCQQCNRVFANPQNLKSHTESQHQKMYRHKCDTCGRGYTQMSHLRRHLRTHSGEQPYSCSYCPKKFTSGAALKIHVRIHTGERPYWCAQCEKGFRSKTKLARHMKTLIHAGGDSTKMRKEPSSSSAPIIEIQGIDVNDVTATATVTSSAPQATWTEIVGIITGV